MPDRNASEKSAAKREWLKVQYEFLGKAVHKPVWVWATGHDEALVRASAIVDRRAMR